MTHFVHQYGEALVFAVVFVEIFGVPFIPGETALIAAAVLAQRGQLSLAWVLVAGVAAAVVGAAAGYGVGRWRGRDILRWGFLARVSEKPLEHANRFFRRHGAKAVFLARFAPILRSTLGWTAGVAHMPFWRFMVWNVAGAAVWGVGIVLLAYYVGKGFVIALTHYGAIGATAVAVLVALALLAAHVWRRRMESA